MPNDSEPLRKTPANDVMAHFGLRVRRRAGAEIGRGLLTREAGSPRPVQIRAGGVLVSLLLATLLLGAGPAAANGLVVAAAASLREPIEQLADEFEARHRSTTVSLNFGASSALGVQIRLGAPVDVFLSADPRIVDDLQARGLARASERFAFASNRLVVMRPGGSDLRITGAADLLGAEVRRIAMPTDAVPLGRYARQWLARHGLIEALTPRLVITEHARATLAAVEAGHANLAIVYATDALVARRASLAFEIPAREQPRIVYAAARLSTGRSPVVGAAFLDELRGPRGSRLLREAGFAPLDPPMPREGRGK